MLKKRPTKRELRERLNHQVERFLQSGGEVKSYERGESGIASDGAASSAYERSIGFEKPKETRTPITDVLNTIDQRRQEKKAPSPKRRRPKKKVIYDDFGEPIRIIWED